MKNITSLLLLSFSLCCSTPALAIIEITGVQNSFILAQSDLNMGSIDLTAEGNAAPFTFIWSNGATTEDISNLAAGTYTVTVTNAFGCTKVLSAKVSSCDGNIPQGTITLSAVIVPVSPYTLTGASIDLQVNSTKTPFEAFHFKWVNKATGKVIAATEDLMNIGEGNYCVTVTGNCAEEASSCFTIGPCSYAIPGGFFSLDFQAAPKPCSNTSNGGIDLTVSGVPGPYTYSWSNQATTEDISNLAAGTYLVKVTDANGCYYSEAFSLPSIIEGINLSVVNACSDPQGGSIDAKVLPVNGSYTFLWSNGASTHKVEHLNAGQYCVTVTDNTGSNCQISKCATINGGGLPSAAIRQEDFKGTWCPPNTGDQCSGRIDVWVDENLAGSGPFNYLYSGPNNFAQYSADGSIANLCQGLYTVTVTGSGGCSATKSFDICCCSGITNSYSFGDCFPDVGNLPYRPISINNVVVTAPGAYNNLLGSVSVFVTPTPAGVNKYFNWEKLGDPGFHSSSSILQDVSAGTYCVTVTDGCTSSSTCVQLDNFVLNHKVKPCCPGGKNGTITVFFDPSMPKPITVSWENGSAVTGIIAESFVISDLAAGSYHITVVDNNNLSTFVNTEIKEEISDEAFGWPFSATSFDPFDPDDQCFSIWSNADIDIVNDIPNHWSGSDFTAYVIWPNKSSSTLLIHPNGDIDVTQGTDSYDIDETDKYDLQVRDQAGCTLDYCFQFGDEVANSYSAITSVTPYGTPHSLPAITGGTCCTSCGREYKCKETVVKDCDEHPTAFSYFPASSLYPCRGGELRVNCGNDVIHSINISPEQEGIEYIDWEHGVATEVDGICRYPVACLYTVLPTDPFFDNNRNYPMYVTASVDLPNSDCPTPDPGSGGTSYHFECPFGVTYLVTDDEKCIGSVLCNATQAILERDIVLEKFIEICYKELGNGRCLRRRICTLSGEKIDEIEVDCPHDLDEPGSENRRCDKARPAGERTEESGWSESNPGSISGLVIFPVPFKQTLNIRFPSDQSGIGQVLIADITGKIIFHLNIPLKMGLNAAQIDLGTVLPSGIYFLTVETPDRKQYMAKLVKY